MSNIAQSLALLRKAAAQFRFYEQNHRAKVARFQDRDEPDQELIRDTLAKADVNADLAQEIEDFLNAF